MFYHQDDANKQKRFLSVLFVAVCSVLLWACQPALQKQDTPSLLSNLLLEDRALPAGWVRMRDMPINSLSDSAINHVYRSWWGKKQNYGGVEQSIWRSVSESNAESFYDETQRGQLGPPIRTPVSGLIYVPYERPGEIGFKSNFASEYDYGCGWSGGPHCVMVARYQNYVTALIIDWQTTDSDGVLQKGLDLIEFEKLMYQVDNKFAEILK